MSEFAPITTKKLRNSSQGRFGKKSTVTTWKILRTNICTRDLNLSTACWRWEQMHSRFLNLLDFTKRMYFLKRNSVISTHRGFHCLLKFCYPYCHWYLGIHMKKLQLYALSRPKANLDTICHFLRFKTREFCLLPDANCKFETCSVPGYLLLFYL